MADEGGLFGPSDGGFLLAPDADGALFGTTAQRDATAARIATVDERGFSFGPDADGALFGPSLDGALFGLGAPAADGLLAKTDGFGLVVCPVPPPGESPRNRLYTETGTEAAAVGSVDSLPLTLEASAMSGVRIELAATPDLFRMPLGDAVVGYAGDRLFSGRVMTASASAGDEAATIEIHGPLAGLKTSGETLSFGDLTYREAIRELYGVVSTATDGRVSGFVETPTRGDGAEGGADATIPAESPLELSGTYKSILDDLHTKAGMAYAVEHGARGDALIESFVPGSKSPRSPTWIADRDVQPTLDLEGYATDVEIRGANSPAKERRYRATASVSDAEVRAVTGGERITYRPPPDDSLDSDSACAGVAQSALAERRGEFTMSGSVPAAPAPVQPGRLYRVPSMDKAAPDLLTPVSLVLRQADYSFARGERSMTLRFETAQGIAGILRRAGGGARASLSRQTGGGMGGDTAFAFARQYPHVYPTGGN